MQRWTCEESRCCRNKSGSEFSRMCRETCHRKIPTSTTTTQSGRTINRISRANVPHLERVFSNLRQQLKRKPEDEKEDLDVNTLIWWMFMTVTYHSTKNQPQRAVKQWFDVTRKLVRDQTEIQGTSMINGQEKSWKRTDSVVWPRSSVINSEILCILRFSIVHGKNQWQSSKRMEGGNR